mgnify:CR=1 FL=1
MFGENLKRIRESRGMSQSELAKFLGTTRQTINRYERNEREPSIKVAAIYADKLGVSVSHLTGHEPPASVPTGFIPIPLTVKRPLVGRIACGDPITAEENIEDYVDVPADVSCDFCLLCSGDSMIDAGISDGDIVYIRAGVEVHDGEIAAVRIGEEATLKRIYIDRAHNVVTLSPANANYAPKQYRDEELYDLHIEGKAVGFTHWF